MYIYIAYTYMDAKNGISSGSSEPGKNDDETKNLCVLWFPISGSPQKESRGVPRCRRTVGNSVFKNIEFTNGLPRDFSHPIFWG